MFFGAFVDLDSAEAIYRVVSVATGLNVGKGVDRQGGYVRRHVQIISKQGH